jgi:hypothetical protein
MGNQILHQSRHSQISSVDIFFLKAVTVLQQVFLPVLISYKQNELVTVNDYQNLSLDHLLDLWQFLSR